MKEKRGMRRKIVMVEKRKVSLGGLSKSEKRIFFIGCRNFSFSSSDEYSKKGL